MALSLIYLDIHCVLMVISRTATYTGIKPTSALPNIAYFLLGLKTATWFG